MQVPPRALCRPSEGGDEVQMGRQAEVGRQDDLVYIHARQREVVARNEHERQSGTGVRKLHQLAAVHACGVAVVVVVVEKRAASVHLHGHIGRLYGRNAVGAAHHRSRYGIACGVKFLRCFHLHAVRVALEVGLAWYGMHYHHRPCRVDNHAHMRVAAAFVGHEHGAACHSGAPPQHHIARSQHNAVWLYGVPSVVCASAGCKHQRRGYHNSHDTGHPYDETVGIRHCVQK